jgi:hypothetical protein
LKHLIDTCFNIDRVSAGRRRRWEGRPNTPPFQWGKEGEIGPTDNEWLNEMDLSALGLAALVNADLVAQNRAALEQVGDAKSSLSDAKSSLGDAESSLSDA